MSEFYIPKKIMNAGTRIGSVFLDHVLMTLIIFIFLLPFILAGSLSEPAHRHFNNFAGSWFIYVFLFGLCLYFCKDCINGRSPAKRIIKLQVVNYNNGEPASPFQCLIRNIFCTVWPIEVIALLINPERRIGDLVAGTKVIYYDPSAEQPKINVKQLIITFAVCYGALLLVTQYAGKKMVQMPKYVESSYNDKESKSLERLYNDSLANYLSAEIKVYDSVENKNYKYITATFRLRKDYLSDQQEADALVHRADRLLYSVFPENSFIGVEHFRYESGSATKFQTFEIGAHYLDIDHKAK